MARQAARDTRVYNGSLTKDGAGTLVLSGLNSYTGGTELRGGELVARSGVAFGTGDVTVVGGRLGGSTTVLGNLLNMGGIIGPGEGNGFGTLNVLGSFAQLSGGLLDFDIGLGGADLLDLAGMALFGGGLDVSFVDGLFNIGSYTLIAAHNYSGRFDTLTVGGLAWASRRTCCIQLTACSSTWSRCRSPRPTPCSWPACWPWAGSHVAAAPVEAER